MHAEHIIFDLDGTLIDSSPSILDAFSNAFVVCGRSPVRPLTPDIIGPPLMATLEILSGTQDAEILNSLATAFKARYDREGHLSTLVFPGIERMLTALADAGIDMSIATNKRLVPTRNILSYLNWLKYFSSVNALDSFTPALRNKGAMLQRMLALDSADTSIRYYIGDRNEDGAAARENKLPFILATWGYGTPLAGATFPEDWILAQSPDDIVQFFLDHGRSPKSRAQ